MRVLGCFVAEMGVVRSVGAGESPGLVRRVSGTVEGTGPRGSRGEDFGITGGGENPMDPLRTVSSGRGAAGFVIVARFVIVAHFVIVAQLRRVAGWGGRNGGKPGGRWSYITLHRCSRSSAVIVISLVLVCMCVPVPQMRSCRGGTGKRWSARRL